MLSPLDSNDSRMQQVWYADGKLFGALDTGVKIQGDSLAGINWFVIDPAASTVVSTGFLASANLNVTYPAIATNRGRQRRHGVHARRREVTSPAPPTPRSTPLASVRSRSPRRASGPRTASAATRPSAIHRAPAGVTTAPPPFDGTDLWIASEYIGQTCTLGEWLTDPIGLCGGTRSALANWGTRISQVTP